MLACVLARTARAESNQAIQLFSHSVNQANSQLARQDADTDTDVNVDM